MDQEIKELLHEHNLRATAPRLRIMEILQELDTPVTYTELVHRMGEVSWDPATTFRNLVKLSKVGICVELKQVGGASRYAMVKKEEGRRHEHPHFVCTRCGDVTCLEATILVKVPPEWKESVDDATIQLSGKCPGCLLTADMP